MIDINDFIHRQRFSQDEQPAIGQRCCFVPAKPIIRDFSVVVLITEPLLNGLQIGQLCTVIQNKLRIVEVKFDGRNETDLVSPEYLVKAKAKDEKDLTKESEE